MLKLVTTIMKESSTFHKTVRKVANSIQSIKTQPAKTYEDAVDVLNTLQSNAATIEKNKKLGGSHNPHELAETVRYALSAGLTLDDIDKLSIIHVSGTKGKGSTCAFCEQILMANGYKTGFFSSPHLVEVRERFRINGKAISKDSFAKYFFQMYNNLDRHRQEHNGQIPHYFRFLTLMAFHIFSQEKVDAAIIEVGVGGAYDSTNIIRKPVVVGISSLGMDHMATLGETIEKIAWQKVGIVKPGVPAFTVNQPGNSLNVLINRAKELGASSFKVAPGLHQYSPAESIVLGLAGEHQKTNASLALQLCKTWIEEKTTDKDLVPFKKRRPNKEIVSNEADRNIVQYAEPFPLSKNDLKGLRDCYWAARNQKVQRDRVTYYIDGAHTPRSVQACVEWFKDEADKDAIKLGDVSIARVLVFNSTGGRKESDFLSILLPCKFDAAAFCPNVVSVYHDEGSADTNNFTTTYDRVMSTCERNRSCWLDLQTQDSHRVAAADSGYQSDSPVKQAKDRLANGLTSPGQEGHDHFPPPPVTGTDSDQLGDVHRGSPSSQPPKKPSAAAKFNCIVDALQWAACAKDSKLSYPLPEDPTPPRALCQAQHIQILVTGSLHLCGGVIKVLDPELATRRKY